MTADFSGWARLYAQSRPRYPHALFEYLAALCPEQHVAWDCATGNGQAAVGLAEHFDRVIATDRSPEQIREAPENPRIEYRVVPADNSGLPDASIDLVTVAAAIHWFDLEAFYREVRRVLKPGGVAAAWTYHVAYVESPAGDIVADFYWNVVAPYFPAGVALVDDQYRAIHLPGNPLPSPSFWMEADWTREQVLAFVSSWSGTQAYIESHGQDSLDRLDTALRNVFPESSTPHRFRWPLYLRLSRL